MAVAALFASHTPLKDYHSPGAAIAREVDACVADLQAWVTAFEPDLVIEFGPDHFNGFFYQLMPSFCVGTEAASIGDWQTSEGALPVAAAAAERLVGALHAAAVDTAISYRMTVDHGLTQLLDLLFERSALPPLVPVFINCAAPPLPPLARVIALGQAVGRFAASLGGNVLIMASGGLSHDPPLPTLATAPAEVRERLIAGGTLSAAARAARQQRVLDEGRRFAAGTSDRTPLNPQWDQAFLAALARADFTALCAMNDGDITRDAGCGGHEVRTWIAAAAALAAAGPFRAELRYYRAIPEWIAGFAAMTAEPAPAAWGTSE